MNRLSTNIPRYFVYTAFKSFGFGLFVAVWLIYLQRERGLSLSQAALVDVTFFVAATLAEVPTGLVADRFGRKTSLALGMALLSLSTLAWVLAPTLLLIVAAYACMGIGVTFLSGAEDALFFESVQRSGRGEDYTRLVGRAGATMTGAFALGSAASGLLASQALSLPFFTAVLCYLLALGVVLSLKEPGLEAASERALPKSPAAVLAESLVLLRSQASLLYPLLYLALVPLAALMLETLFVQPQALKLGVPVAGVGLVVMALQLVNVAGSAWADWLGKRLGQKTVLYAAPILIVASLGLLAALQIPPALLFIALISFSTAVLRPLVMGRIQGQISDQIRATVLSLQSLLATVLAAVAQPSLGLVADKAGLPSTYWVLAGSLGLLTLLLLWRGRAYFP